MGSLVGRILYTHQYTVCLIPFSLPWQWETFHLMGQLPLTLSEHNVEQRPWGPRWTRSEWERNLCCLWDFLWPWSGWKAGVTQRCPEKRIYFNWQVDRASMKICHQSDSWALRRPDMQTLEAVPTRKSTLRWDGVLVTASVYWSWSSVRWVWRAGQGKIM